MQVFSNCPTWWSGIQAVSLLNFIFNVIVLVISFAHRFDSLVELWFDLSQTWIRDRFTLSVFPPLPTPFSFPGMLKVSFFSPSPIAESADFLYAGSAVKGSSCQETNGLPFWDNGLLVVSAIWTEWQLLGDCPHKNTVCLSHEDRLAGEQIDLGLLCSTDWLSGSCLVWLFVLMFALGQL